MSSACTFFHASSYLSGLISLAKNGLPKDGLEIELGRPRFRSRAEEGENGAGERNRTSDLRFTKPFTAKLR